MAFDEVVESEELKEVLNGEDPSSVSVDDLVSEFGPEAVRRGIQYMASLEEADNKFAEVNEEMMEEGYRSAGVTGDVSAPAMKWKESMKTNGLGLEDSDE